jgi:hypothetical protein
MGGFSGSDDAPSVAQLTEWKQQGQLGFVLLGGGPGGMRMAGGGDQQLPEGADQQEMRDGPGGQISSEREEWVKQNCTLVDPAVYGGSADSSNSGSSLQLYVCK